MSDYKYWRLNGELHREDGPAVEYVAGSNWWYLDCESYNEAEHTAEMPKRNEQETANDRQI